MQSFHGVVKPLGETRPAWKVLRVLGNLLGLPGFDHETVEEVRAEALGDAATLASRLGNRSSARRRAAGAAVERLERMADVPIYATDPLVRRAPSLQLTADAQPPVVGLPSALWHELGLRQGAARARDARAARGVAAGAASTRRLPPNAVRVPAGHAHTATLGAMFGPITRREGVGRRDACSTPSHQYGSR